MEGADPAQRRDDRRARFIDAGIDIMGTRGVRAVTVRAVCRTAHLGERQFYEEFSSKDAYVQAVYEDVLTHGARMFDAMEAAAPGGPEQILRHLLDVWIAFVEEDPRRGRIVAVEGATDPALARRGRRAAVDLMTLYLARTSTGPVPQLSPSEAEITATALFVGIWGVLLAWLAGELDHRPSRAELIDHLVTLIQRAQPR